MPEASILVEDHILDIAHCVKFLGLFIDDELKFNMHIHHIYSMICMYYTYTYVNVRNTVDLARVSDGWAGQGEVTLPT